MLPPSAGKNVLPVTADVTVESQAQQNFMAVDGRIVGDRNAAGLSQASDALNASS